MESDTAETVTCTVSLQAGCLVVDDPQDQVRGRHSSQLAYWGFVFDSTTHRFVQRTRSATDSADRIVRYLEGTGVHVTIADDVARVIAKAQEDRGDMVRALHAGAATKNGQPDLALQRDFRRFLARSVPRKLKDHQIKAALHLLTVRNGANFSVPGSGKTTVALAVFRYLQHLGVVNCLFVVGPPSCFGPWKTEYQKTIGQWPDVVVLAGGDIAERRRAYAEAATRLRDLYLTSFQTLQRDKDWVRAFFGGQGILAFLVVDEGHYIKQGGGAWATAALEVANRAVRRVIMTGTPFPQGYSDAFNLTDVLWPKAPPLDQDDRGRITHGSSADAINVLDKKVSPLFYRVRKRDLHLTPQDLREPTLITMNPHERQIYDAILSRMRDHPLANSQSDWDALARLRRGRLIRLRQCTSYPGLLRRAIPESDEDVSGPDPALTTLISRYDELESPAKLCHLEARVDALRKAGEKVLVWATFVGTLELIRDRLRARGHAVGLIYGATPLTVDDEDGDESREHIIDHFVQRDGGLEVLVANPAACAESISLHSTCSHALYYDLAYNCAQYLQSLDRIHRVGGSERIVAHYEFLQCADTIDQDILRSVRSKAARMAAIIDQDYPIYDLDMTTADDDENAAYDRIIG